MLIRVIVTAAGSFQSEIGCSGDWDPSCLRSWLQDPDGDGIYTFSTKLIPPGNYEVKAAINEGWTVNYGVGGVLGGGNILFTVPPATIATIFSYNANSHILSVSSKSKKKHPQAFHYFCFLKNLLRAVRRSPS